jgi:CheY-like chemotaxis protein
VGDGCTEPMNRTVLYIEDNADNRYLVERILKRRPHIRVRVAINAHDGVEAALADPPDLILLDNHLPDGTGSEVLHQLASSKCTAAIPVVVLTGDSSPTTADELLAIGATDFLAKPYDIHEFYSMIDRNLR